MNVTLQVGGTGRIGNVGLDADYLWSGGVDTNGLNSRLDDNRLARITSNSGAGTASTHWTGTNIVGKKYVEILIKRKDANAYIGVGVGTTVASVWYAADTGVIFNGNGGCGLPAVGYSNNGTWGGDAAYTWVEGDLIGIAYDATTRELWFSRNGIWLSGDPSFGTSPTMTVGGSATFRFFCSIYTCSSGGVYDQEIRSQWGLQTYPAPIGFSAYDSAGGSGPTGAVFAPASAALTVTGRAPTLINMTDLVVLLINPNGVAGSTTYTDLSLSPQTITNGASPPQQTGTGLMTFTGAAGCVLTGTAAKMNLSGSDWCVEFFVNLTGVGTTQEMFSSYSTGQAVGNDPTGNLYEQPNGGSFVTTGNGAFAAGTLQHVAVNFVNSGTSCRIYVDGVLKAGPTNVGATGNNQAWTLGARTGGTLRCTGTFGQVRITKASRYTGASFTPPTSFV